MKIENVAHENDHKVSSSVLSNLSTLRKVFFPSDSKPPCGHIRLALTLVDKSENLKRIFMLKIF